MRTPDMRNGTIPNHACPPNMSISSGRGISGRSTSTGTAQCANNKSCHSCFMIHGPRGNSHGRCAVCFKISIIKTRPIRFSTSCCAQYTLPQSPRIESLRNDAKKRGYMDRKASAVWTGGLKDGKGTLSTDSGVLKQAQYSFSTRFENGIGTNPEELLAAAHAGCFTMALSAQLGNAGMTAQKLETTATVTLAKVGEGFSITKSHLDLVANIPGADKAKFDAAVKAAETGCPVSKLFKAEITVNARLQS